MQCGCSGATVKRHDEISLKLYEWLLEHCPNVVTKEQCLEIFEGPHNETGRMDIIAHKEDGTPEYVDITVGTVISRTPAKLAAAALHDGAMAAMEEREKLARYPMAPNLVPFVIEMGGRAGNMARAFVRRHAPIDLATRTVAIASLWQDISVVLQRHNALMWLRAEGK